MQADQGVPNGRQSRMVQEAVLLFCIREFYILCLEDLKSAQRSMKLVRLSIRYVGG